MAEALWTGVAQTYARSFAGLCGATTASMLEGVPSGTRLLDVGCGTGALMLAARDAGIETTGVEPDAELATMAGEQLGAAVITDSLPNLPFADDSFDHVIANFVINHVDDPRAAARELARVTAPGGSVRATIWPGFPSPQAELWGAVIDRAGAVRPQLPKLAEHLDFERSCDGLASILSEAGLEPVATSTPAWVWRVDPDDFLAGVTAVGNFGVTWQAQSAEVQDRMRVAYADAIGPWLEDGRLAFAVECVLVVAVAS